MKKTPVVAILLALITLLTISCSSGVSRDQYKKATDDLAAAQSQVQALESQLSAERSQTQSLQSQLNTAQSQNQSLQTQLSAAQSQSQSLQTQLSAAQSQAKSLQTDLQALNDRIAKARAVAELVDSMMQTYLSSENLTTTQGAALLAQWSNNVKTVGDPQLTAKFDALMKSATSDRGVEAAAEDFTFYLFSLQAKLLQ